MDIRKVSDMVYHDDDKYKMEEMNKVYYKMADFIKERNPDVYDQFVIEAEDIAYKMTRTDAEDIVMKMKPYGQHWSYEDVKNYIAERGMDGSLTCDYYVAMNMAFNDYNRTARQYGIDRPEFYYDIAWDFLNDEDGPSHKVAKYYSA